MRHGVKELVIPSKEYLDECFVYNPESGDLTWKSRPEYHFKNKNGQLAFNGAHSGKRAGAPHIQKGRASCIQVRINNRCYRAHRLIFRIMGLEIPEGMMGDHENRNPVDNRWANLRLATRTQNNRNGSVRRNNTSGVAGVQLRKSGNYFATITVDLKSVYLGTFKTIAEAANARRAAEQQYFKEYAPR